METISQPLTQKWAIDAVVARLQQNEQVEGLLLIGSSAKNELTPASDYDLVIFLRESPLLWYVGVTTIDDRFADLIFVAAAALKSILDLGAPVPQTHELEPVLRWLRTGVILFDRTGPLEHAQRKVQGSAWISGVEDGAAYGAWFALNYNLAVARRMACAADELYQTTAAIRMAVYGHADLWFGYFTIRKLVWEGDKPAVRYLQRNDPWFLETYQRFITAASLEHKLRLYEQAAALAAAPLGGVWPAHITAMNNAQAFQTWQKLLGE
jgi:hypothetical protein